LPEGISLPVEDYGPDYYDLPIDFQQDEFVLDLPIEEEPQANPELANRAKKIIRLQGEYEKDVLRFLLSQLQAPNNLEIVTYLKDELAEIVFSDPILAKIYGLFCNELELGRFPSLEYFMSIEDRDMVNFIAGLISNPVQVSANWKNMHNISTQKEEDNLADSAVTYVFRLKLLIIRSQLYEIHKKLKTSTDAETDELLTQYQVLKQEENALGVEIGQVISDFHIGGATA
jgi:DNA primase